MLLSAALLTLVAASEPQPSADDVRQWLAYYYLDPRPELALPSLAVLDREADKSAAGSLANQATRGGIRTFYAKVFERNEAIVTEAGQKLEEMPIGERTFVEEALRRCNSEPCARALGSDLTRPARTVHPDVSSLDDAWAAFFATGDAEYVRQVIAVLPWSEVRDNAARAKTGAAAVSSLTGNASRHSRVLAICEEAASTAAEPTRRLLEEIVARAKEERAKSPPPEPKAPAAPKSAPGDPA